MAVDIGAYQIVYDEALLPFLDTGYQRFDWMRNPRPELREVAAHDALAQSLLYKRHDICGAISPKFFSKTNLTAHDVYTWIHLNPGYDIYIINGYPHLPYLLFNSIERGRDRHCDFENIFKSLSSALRIQVCEPLRRENNSNLALGSFWFANSAFWDCWSAKILEPMSRGRSIPEPLFSLVSTVAKYVPEAPIVRLVPFLYERILPYFVEEKKFKALYFQWKKSEILRLRIKPLVREYLQNMISIVDQFDRKGRWTEYELNLLRTFANPILEQVSRVEFDASNEKNYNIPKVTVGESERVVK